MGLIFFLLLLCLTAFEAAQDPHAQPQYWDERYEPFICHVGFLPLAQLINHSLLLMDAVALMALVYRWCSETHTFHLPFGEITVTLQDVAMILGLPIDDTPICGMVSSAGWRDSVGQAIGLRPPDVPGDHKDNKMTSMHSRSHHALGLHRKVQPSCATPTARDS
jgi:hypothetical protein